MKKMSVMLIMTALMLGSTIRDIYAQQTSYELKKASNQYTASGTVSITKNNTTFNYSATMKDLPSPLPASGLYYILWALTADGKADNLGPITNTTGNQGKLDGRVTQFFITSEKERFPEYVTGPRIVQTGTIPESTFSQSNQTASSNPTPRASTSPRPNPTKSIIPIGGPVGAPETGLGGAILLNGIIYSLGGIGFTGLGISFYNKLKKKSHK